MRRLSLAVLWAAMGPMVALRGQDGSANRATLATPHDGLLLLKNGNVLEGRITWSGDHYFVDRGGLQMGVRAAEVLTTASDLDDAYRKQRDLLARDDLDGRQTLAQWCLRHDLLGYAAAELAECTALQPRNRRTESLLRQLQSAVRVARDKPSAVETEAMESGSAPPLETPPVEAGGNVADRALPTASVLDTVSGDVVEMFVTKVQPLIVNQCATGGCHGGMRSAAPHFQRFDPRKTASRAYTERNLAAALALVDRQRPDESRLVTAPSQPHGPAKRPIFEGRTLGYQADLLAWARLVARDAGNSGRRAEGGADTNLAGRRASLGGTTVIRAAYEESSPKAVGDRVQPAISAENGDASAKANPHDPDLFNRRFFPDGRPHRDEVAADVSVPRSSLPPALDERRPLPKRRPPVAATRQRSIVEEDIPPFESIEEGEVAPQQPR